MKEEGTLLNGIAPHAISVGRFTNDLLALLGTKLTYGHNGTIGEHGHNCWSQPQLASQWPLWGVSF